MTSEPLGIDTELEHLQPDEPGFAERVQQAYDREQTERVLYGLARALRRAQQTRDNAGALFRVLADEHGALITKLGKRADQIEAALADTLAIAVEGSATRYVDLPGVGRVALRRVKGGFTIDGKAAFEALDADQRQEFSRQPPPVLNTPTFRKWLEETFEGGADGLPDGVYWRDARDSLTVTWDKDSAG